MISLPVNDFHTQVTFIFMASRLHDLWTSATTNCFLSNIASTNLHRPISNLKISMAHYNHML